MRVYVIHRGVEQHLILKGNFEKCGFVFQVEHHLRRALRGDWEAKEVDKSCFRV